MSEPHYPDPHTTEPSSGKQTIGRVFRRVFQKSLRFSSIAYFIFLLLLYVGLHFVGEKNGLVSLVLYVPPHVWLVPCGLLALLSLRRTRRSLVWNLCSVAFVLTFIMQWHWSWRFDSDEPALKIVTANLGQRRAKVEEFLRAENPDICLFQEAWRFGPILTRQMPGYYTAAVGEFSIASKHEIVNSGFVPKVTDWRGVPVAAWFELNYQGRRIVIYNVHLPTPRRDFELLRGEGWLTEWRKRGGIFNPKVRSDYRQAMARRIEVAASLKKRLDQEERPFIAAGDFNMPAQGVVRNIFTQDLTDLFAAKGRGYGFTFPGNAGPLNLAGPWLRLDYIFAGPGWDPVVCRVEPKKDAQHLAVVGTVRLKDKPSE